MKPGIYEGGIAHINMIMKILANPTYTGAVVNNKTDNVIVSVKSPKARPREEWIYVPNKHEAIVTKDEMEIVMGMIKPSTYHKKLDVPRNIFRSKVKCGHCQRMLRARDGRGVDPLSQKNCLMRYLDIWLKLKG